MVDYFLWFVLEFKVMRGFPSLLLIHLPLMVRRFRWFQLKKALNKNKTLTSF